MPSLTSIRCPSNSASDNCFWRCSVLMKRGRSAAISSLSMAASTFVIWREQMTVSRRARLNTHQLSRNRPSSVTSSKRRNDPIRHANINTTRLRTCRIGYSGPSRGSPIWSSASHHHGNRCRTSPTSASPRGCLVSRGGLRRRPGRTSVSAQHGVG